MHRLWIVTGGLAGFGTVGMAAVGSHVLSGRLDARGLHWIDVAVQMQGWHALALVACGILAGRAGPIVHVAGALFLLGTILFCGALYVLAIGGTSLGPVAPAGGLCLMAGWLALAAAGLRRS